MRLEWWYLKKDMIAFEKEDEVDSVALSTMEENWCSRLHSNNNNYNNNSNHSGNNNNNNIIIVTISLITIIILGDRDNYHAIIYTSYIL